MKKKIYKAPALSVEEFEMSDIVCGSNSNKVTNVSSGDVGLDFRGGGNGPARGKSHNGIWDED